MHRRLNVKFHNAAPHITQLYWTSLTAVHGDHTQCGARHATSSKSQRKRVWLQRHFLNHTICLSGIPQAVYVWWILFLSLWIREQP